MLPSIHGRIPRKVRGPLAGLGLAVALVLPACGKEAVDVDHAYVGQWRKEGSHNADTCDPIIVIQSSGQAKYYSDTQVQGCSKIDHSGTARIENGHLRIGSKSMLIDQAPTAIPQRAINYSAGPGTQPGTTSMMMKLDGIVLYRIDGK